MKNANKDAAQGESPVFLGKPIIPKQNYSLSGSLDDFVGHPGGFSRSKFPGEASSRRSVPSDSYCVVEVANGEYRVVTEEQRSMQYGDKPYLAITAIGQKTATTCDDITRFVADATSKASESETEPPSLAAIRNAIHGNTDGKMYVAVLIDPSQAAQAAGKKTTAAGTGSIKDLGATSIINYLEGLKGIKNLEYGLNK